MKVSVNRLHSCFFWFKNPIFRFCVCSKIGLAQLWKAFLKICFLSQGKEISFLRFHNHGWGSAPHFMMIEKVRLNLKYLKVKTRQSEMMLPKSYSTFSHQHLQLFLKSCKFKNLNLWLQRKFDSRKEMHSSFLLILLI